MGDSLVKTFQSVGLFLQVPFAGNCKLATLLQKRKLCTKHRLYNGLSLLFLEGQITLHLFWCNKLLVMLGLKLGVNLELKLGVKLGEKIPHWPS